jgi:hypothetical protein
MRPPVAPPAGLPEVPTVVEPIGAPLPLDVDPEELAVPPEFVPGVLIAFAALPAPLESLPELLRPPTLAGPGAPSAELAPAEPTPCAPAGDEAAPAAAPLDVVPPPDPPPAPPAPPPPPPCARAEMGDSRAVTRTNLHNEQGMGKIPFDANAVASGEFQKMVCGSAIGPEARRRWPRRCVISIGAARPYKTEAEPLRLPKKLKE